MIKLWFVLTIFGNIVLVAGIVPYDMEECVKRAKNHIEGVAKNIRNAEESIIYKGRMVTVEDVAVNCVVREVRPEIGDPLYG